MSEKKLSKNVCVVDSKKLVELEKKTKVDSKKIVNLEKKNFVELKKIGLLEKKNKEMLGEMKNLKKEVKKVSVEKTNVFINELRKQVLTLSVAAFGFLAALTWRDVINAFLAPILKGREGLLEFFLVALFVTCLAIIVPIMLTKLLSVEKQETKK
jgi:hypothetical protein